MVHASFAKCQIKFNTTIKKTYSALCWPCKTTKLHTFSAILTVSFCQFFLSNSQKPGGFIPSTVRAPVFDRPQFSAHQSTTEKPMEVYYLDEWIIITLHVAGFLHPAIFQVFHHSSDNQNTGAFTVPVHALSCCCCCFFGGGKNSTFRGVG